MVVTFVLVVVLGVAIISLLICLLGFCRELNRRSAASVSVFRIEEERAATPQPQGKASVIAFPKKISRPEKRFLRSKMMVGAVSILFFASSIGSARAQTSLSDNNPEPEQQEVTSAGTQNQPSKPALQYGGFIDSAYIADFNYPANHLFRSRGTAYMVNEPIINMSAAYLRKAVAENSRLGFELTVQAGQDSRVFGFSATAPNIAGYRGLRHLGPTNISYLAPVGKGLTLQAGIFSSLIGYDSLYAKDNFSYTRPWGADFTPYLMMGANAAYPISPKLTGVVFLIHGYWHLARANSVPSTGGQLAYKPTQRMTLKQTVLYGPHQSDTALEFWRFLSDSIAEWKRDPLTVALEYQASTEKVAITGNPRALWMSGQLPAHWAIDKHWAVTVRPEVAWDRDGRWTGFAQTVKALTNTIECRVPYRQTSAIFRLEHRIDDSRGPGGGFFRSGFTSPGVPQLTPRQNLLTFAVILTLDGTWQPRK